MTATETLSGQCHCGAVRWQVTLPPKLVINCHCNLCRQLSGADYSSWVIFPEVQFRLLGGEAMLSHYQAAENFSKTFCSCCGATVFAINNSKFPGCVYVARGNITTPVELPVNFQVFTNDKAPWVCLSDVVPVFNP